MWWCLFGKKHHPQETTLLLMYVEFLTHETTCASEMLEKTTCENFCQKNGTLARRHVRGTPCRHHHWRHPGMPPSPLAAGWHAAITIGGRVHAIFILFTCTCCMTSPCRQRGWRQGRPETTAAGACRHWPRRHVPRVARGCRHSQVVFFSISLAQVVSCVKNSCM
jgi:hypothetical protein